MTLARVEGAVCGDAADLLIGRDLIEEFGQHVRGALEPMALRRSPSPTSLVVNSAARISSVFSSIPIWILRQTRRLEPPCLRAFHSPSPSTFMPVLSTKRCSGPCEPRSGMATFKVFWRRLRVLKSGTAQFKPISRSRLSTKPVVCLSAMPNSPGALPVQG
jgi:hypothetical protein